MINLSTNVDVISFIGFLNAKSSELHFVYYTNIIFV